MPERPLIFDKAKYHLEGDYPRDVSPGGAFVHTGYFLGWLADHDLLSREALADFSEEIQEFRRRQLTGPELYKVMGGVLDDALLNENGLSFSSYYFDFDKGDYLRDYSDLLANTLPTLYHVPDNWENYERLSRVIANRFEEWTNNRQVSG